MTQSASPFLQGVFAPWRQEDNIAPLEVIGKLPADLQGVLLRNGPNPQFDPIGAYHWFNGDGMLHAIRIQNGQACYDNRWIRTPAFNLEREAGRPLFNSDLTQSASPSSAQNMNTSPANTNIISYHNRLLALCEGGLPVEIQGANLHTLGEYTFGGQIQRALTAHPRFDHRCQEFLTYSYIDVDGRLLYYRLDRHQQLIAKEAIAWPYASMMHDFVNTEHTVIFSVFPCTMSIERMMRGESIFMWEGDQLQTHFIVTDRMGKEVLRIETDPCYVYHFGNAYEEGHTLVIDALKSAVAALMPDRQGQIVTDERSAAHLVRWRIDLQKRSIQLEDLDLSLGEFPRFDERFNGYSYRYLYRAGQANPGLSLDRIMAHDLLKNKKSEHIFGADMPGEPVFVPRSPQEGWGYILTVVYRTEEDRSDVVVLDAQQIDAEPLAIIKIPHRIPFGFHGNFIPAA